MHEIPARASATNHYNKGIRYLEENQAHPNALAEQQFKIAIDKDPDFAEAHMNLGVYYLRTGWLAPSDDDRLATFTPYFGKPIGTFTWQGRIYHYSLPRALPRVSRPG